MPSPMASGQSITNYKIKMPSKSEFEMRFAPSTDTCWGKNTSRIQLKKMDPPLFLILIFQPGKA